MAEAPEVDTAASFTGGHGGRMSKEDHAAFGHAHREAARAHNADASRAATGGAVTEHKELARENETEAARHFEAAGEPATLANPLGVDPRRPSPDDSLPETNDQSGDENQ